MAERVKPTVVRQRLGDLLTRVADRQDQFVIERRGKPLAALVSFEQFEQLQRAARTDLLSLLDREQQRLTRKQARELARRAVRRGQRSS